MSCVSLTANLVSAFRPGPVGAALSPSALQPAFRVHTMVFLGSSLGSYAQEMCLGWILVSVVVQNLRDHPHHLLFSEYNE